MENSVKQRLKDYLCFKKININFFENAIGVSNGYVGSMRKSIQPDKLESIALKFPDLNITWLLTGIGEMDNNQQINNNIGHHTNGNYSPITGNIEINTCRQELEKANLKISLLEQIIKDKERIIELLTLKNK
ncbi:MAG: XRE family transcriptional regulator [Paludibacter sp.]|nr:XRE family transcriptional regulator [Paludibacter sp.]